jgi:hypothetical protein
VKYTSNDIHNELSFPPALPGGWNERKKKKGGRSGGERRPENEGGQHRQLRKIAQGEEASQRPIEEQYVGDRAQYRAIFGKTLSKVKKLERKRPGKRE